MNRREAIKKIGAGGAIAAGASVVLSSTDVAHAASPPDTGLTNVPAQFEPLPIVFTPNSNGTVTIDATSNAGCTSGATPTVIYSWKVNSFSFGSRRRRRRWRLRVRNERRRRQIIHDTRRSTGYSASSTALSAIRIEKTTNTRRRRRRRLGSNDSYNLSVIVSWQCAGANSSLEAEYTISGTGQAAPVVSNTAYNVF